MWKICALFFLSAILAGATGKPCAARKYAEDRFMCVCNKTYCDSLDTIQDSHISGGKFLHYVSTNAGLRLEPLSGSFKSAVSDASASATFTVKPDTTYQDIYGFGGALSDTATYNIYTLSEETRQQFLQTYYGEGGSNYVFMRTNMGGCDYSLSYYSYIQPGDVNVTSFSLSEMDTKYKVPFMKEASKVRGQTLKMYTTVWSAPTWMKDTGDWYKGVLLEEYYSTWAKYFVKYFEAYKKEGIEFWGVTPQNEPTQTSNSYPVMHWSVEQLNVFVGKHLGPALNESGFSGLKLMTLDDNRNVLPEWADKSFKDADASKYYSGVALHWYRDQITNPHVLTTTHDHNPNKFLFYSEVCNDAARLSAADYGEWTVGEKYGKYMFQAFNNWVNGWADWNLAVSTHGGPTTHKNVTADYGYNSAILINATVDEFLKQPIYYFQAHFSMFVPEGSKRVELTSSSDGDLANVAFVTPKKEYVVIFMNAGNSTVQAVVNHSGKGSLTTDVPARSINTIIYK